MLPHIQCKMGVISRLLNKKCVRVSSVFLNIRTGKATSVPHSQKCPECDNTTMETDSLCTTQKHKCLKNSDQRNTTMFEDSAILFVGRTMAGGQRDSEEKFRLRRENYNRRSVPYSSSLLENSFNLSQPQKRRTHLSGETYDAKVAKTEHSRILDETTNQMPPLDAGYGAKRHWELTNLGIERLQRPNTGFEFFVMSYNILAQNLLIDNQYLYTESPEYVLDWGYRSEKLLQEIHALNPEIMCLQEVHQKHYHDFLEPRLKQMGYNAVYVKRTGDKLDGCATFYKTEKFTLEETVLVPYYKSNCNLLDRDNVGLIVKLQPNKRSCSQEDSICVANTHLLFNPKRGDIKLAQVICLLAELEKVSKITDSVRCQVLVCGDFNATPVSDLYKFMIHGYLRYDGLLSRLISGQSEGQYRGTNHSLSKDFFPSHHKISDQCRHIKPGEKLNKALRREDLNHRNSPSTSQSSGCLWHHLNLVSTYRHTIERLGHREAEVTTQHSGDNCTVDYIFYGVEERDVHTRRNKHQSRNIKEKKLKLLGRWGLMSAREIREEGNLPNHYHPSDHMPLLVKMLLV